MAFCRKREIWIMNFNVNDNFQDLSKSDLQLAIRTLVAGGFILQQAIRNPGYTILLMERVDEFEVVHKYCFALSELSLNGSQIEAAKIAANHHNSQLVIIGEQSADIPSVDWARFLNLFGGPVLRTSPLEPEFTENLIELSYNRLPNDLQGAPDALFELFVQVALEFIFACKVTRYGQDRRFGARPDGVIFSSSRFTAIYDTKAYSEGFKVDKSAMRQFSAYVKDFTRRYNAYFPRLNSFIVISSEFPHRNSTLEGRSRELFADTGVLLNFLTASSLSKIVDLSSEYPRFRRSIDWPLIFSESVVNPDKINDELVTLKRDSIIPEQ